MNHYCITSIRAYWYFDIFAW